MYDLGEADDVAGEDLLTDLITTSLRDEKVRSNILKDLSTPTLDQTMKLIERMVYFKDTNEMIRNKYKNAKASSINKFCSGKKPT